MAELKNIHLLSEVLNTEDMENIEAGALLYRRHGSIIFKVKNVNASKMELVVTTIQRKNYAENYLDVKSLVDRTEGLFGNFFPGWKIYAQVTPYQPAPASTVTPEWIEYHLADKKINISRIFSDTGIDITNLSAWVNGKRPMSQITKAMFYYYFKSL